MPNNHIGDSPSKRHIPNSRILTWIDKLCDIVYARLAGGMFGTLFTKYPGVGDTLFGRFCESDLRKKKFSPARRSVASKLEGSAIAGTGRRFMSYLLAVRLRIYGIFLFSFLSYTAIFAAIGVFRGRNEDISSALFPAIVSLSAVPTFFTGKSLAEALCTSRLGRAVLRMTGGRAENLNSDRRAGRGDMAFIAALVLSIATLKIPFWHILGAIAMFCAAAVILHSPEFGTVCLFFLLPFSSTVPLVLLVILTFASFLLKALLARRVFRIEAVDLMLLLYIGMLVVGMLFGASWSSLSLGAMTIVIVSGYYLVVFTMTSREWLRRAALAMLTSCTAISLVRLVQYAGRRLVGAAVEGGLTAGRMFGFVTGHAFEASGNSRIFSVYLIIVLPVALCAVITFARSIRQRLASFLAFSAIALCLGLQGTRGAWVGALVSLALFVMIWGRRSIYAFICAVLSIPFLAYIIPDAVRSRFAGIGILADPAIAFRVNILKSVSDLLPRLVFNGIGLGADSWNVVWPGLAAGGAEGIPHTYNLFVQIWMQTGLVSLLLFLSFVLLLFLSNFNFYKRLKDANETIMAHISVSRRKDETVTRVRTEQTGRSAEKKKTVMRLEAAAPLCGMSAALVMGLTDYVWYNYRILLVFWLACGLSAAYVRVGRRELEYSAVSSSPTEAEVQIVLAEKNNR